MLTDARSVDSTALPLVVDMDGTLLATDSLLEGILLLVKRRPFAVLALPWWLRRGKAAFKREIADRVRLAAAELPYDQRLLEFVREQHGTRPVILCTASDERYASAVASHLAVFDDVIATASGVNMRAGTKARTLASRFGHGGFDYVGNDRSDIPVFAEARRSIVVNPTWPLRRRLASMPNVHGQFEATGRGSLRAYLLAMRPHHWVKNLLVFIPLLATFDPGYRVAAFATSLVAFVAFSALASSVYLLNDLLDLSADRRHPTKRQRPIAAGTVPIAHALALMVALFTVGLLVATRVSALFVVVLLTYWVVTNLYSFWLKRVPLLDTIILSGLYTLRILGGAAAIRVTPSVWLLAFSIFFFLSLALAKRHSELVAVTAEARTSALPGREYRPEDLATLMSEGSASGYAAVLVLALYISSSEVHERYNNPAVIWLICPLLLYWVNKLWLNSQRGELDDDPVVWAFTNRVSRAVAGLSIVLLLLARYTPRFW